MQPLKQKESQMNTKYLKIARRLWTVDYIPVTQQRYNIRGWIQAVRRLGDKSLLAKNVERI